VAILWCFAFTANASKAETRSIFISGLGVSPWELPMPVKSNKINKQKDLNCICVLSPLRVLYKDNLFWFSNKFFKGFGKTPFHNAEFIGSNAKGLLFVVKQMFFVVYLHYMWL
jgi:hypothetical protein